VIAYSPNHEAAVSFDGEGYILNRRILPQKQLLDAQKLGVEIRGNIALRSVLVEDDKVVGIEGQDLKTNEAFKKTSKLVVDASYFSSRTSLPMKSYIQKKIDRLIFSNWKLDIYNFENRR
jgi:flavin-dependent dehydrogenase